VTPLLLSLCLLAAKPAEYEPTSNYEVQNIEGWTVYFGTNDFYPFVRAEIMAHDPQMHKLLKKLWGRRDSKGRKSPRGRKPN